MGDAVDHRLDVEMQVNSTGSIGTRQPESRSSGLAPRRRLRMPAGVQGYLFIAPWIIGLLCFQALPILSSLWISLTKWDGMTPAQFLGLQQYQTMINDPLFLKALLNTFAYVGMSVPLQLLLALFLAVMLNRRSVATGFFRTLFYLPSVISGAALAVIWIFMFDPTYGAVNSILGDLGIPGPQWLGSVQWALPSLVLISLFSIGTPMVIFLAGLQSIPTYVYEAATIDGASRLRQLWSITVPLLMPTVFFNAIILMIGSFQVFTSAFVMTQGGPVNATLVLLLYIYQQGFQYLNMGYASAIAWVLTVVIMLVAIVQIRLGQGVNYDL
jgi:multiple sugar transport system permease protein